LEKVLKFAYKNSIFCQNVRTKLVVTESGLKPTSTYEINALELLAWMIGKDYLDVKLAIPCSVGERKPIASYGIFHEKAGIIEDKLGNRLAFNGSVNETAQGWTENWESFHVFTDWNNSKNHVDEEERSFAKLWNNQATRCLVVDVQTAVKAELLKFLPPNDNSPVRLTKPETKSCLLNFVMFMFLSNITEL